MESYKTIKKIGSGNFAKVYLAVHQKSGRQVALKLVEKKANRNATTVRRISREIENMKVLEGHRNIVGVVDSKFTKKKTELAKRIKNIFLKKYSLLTPISFLYFQHLKTPNTLVLQWSMCLEVNCLTMSNQRKA